MSLKPTFVPTWATNATFASPGDSWDGDPTKVDPGAGKRAEGWEPTETPPAEFFNFEQNIFGQWFAFVDDHFDDLDNPIYPIPKSRTVFIGPHGFGIGTEGLVFGATPSWFSPTRLFVQSNTVVTQSAELMIDVTNHMVSDMDLTSVSALVKPGDTRTGGNRMQLNLFRLENFDTFPGVALVEVGLGNDPDDGTTNDQKLTIGGLGETTERNRTRFVVEVISGVDPTVVAPDRLYGIELNFVDIGPRNN